MKIKRRLELRIRGWFPQEPQIRNFAANNSFAPKTKAELDKKLYKHSSIANVIVMSTSLGINALLIQPHYNHQVTAESTILFFSIFLPSLLTANLLLYWHYKKQLRAKGSK
ncbi:MAG: hypothetical protein ACQCN5_05540 [Candidatus Bathyarchaeia archaeon]|jgi:hypothetical protein